MRLESRLSAAVRRLHNHIPRSHKIVTTECCFRSNAPAEAEQEGLRALFVARSGASGLQAG